MSVMTVRKVLEVARDFDCHGGVSLELLAWEVGCEEAEIAGAWDDAVEGGLLGEGETPPEPPAHWEMADWAPEQMWRLTPAGWSLLGVDPAADRLRAATIARLGLLDQDASPEFDALARLAASLLGTMGSAINIVDERYQHRIAAVSAPIEAAPAHESFCRVTVDAGVPVDTANAADDERFAHSSFAHGDAPMGFYASAPLRAESTVIGTICVFDLEPRAITEAERRHLEDLASLTEAQIELNRLRIDQATHVASVAVG